MTEIEVRAWFTEVNDYLADSGFQHVIDHPDRVFNMDESSFEMAPNPNKKEGCGEKRLENCACCAGKFKSRVLHGSDGRFRCRSFGSTTYSFLIQRALVYMARKLIEVSYLHRALIRFSLLQLKIIATFV